MSVVLNPEYYCQKDVVSLAKNLIGKVLVTNFGESFTSGLIVETEAYSGNSDLACHASKGKTKRTSTMYKEGGRSYVYLCYGIHRLLNVVTNTNGYPDAVLIRAIQPIEGKQIMMQRRNKMEDGKHLTNGPGSLSMALGINMSHNNVIFGPSSGMWIEDRSIKLKESIKCSSRVGVAYAKNDALLPWRFYLDKCEFVSKGKYLNQ